MQSWYVGEQVGLQDLGIMLFMGVCEFLTCVRSGEKRMASASAEPLQGES